jgi:5-methylcytosine-specific restriction endonuclease McrA
MLESTRCVILNASYEPLSIVSAKRGLVLVIEGKAFISEAHPNGSVRTVTKKYPLPTQVVLKQYVRSRPAMRVPAQLTQKNLFTRDGFTCQYCGRHRKELRANEFLTRDHIVPARRGGKDVWTNVVAACNACNNKKADYTLEEARQYCGMELRSKPKKPTVFDIWAKTELAIPKRQ